MAEGDKIYFRQGSRASVNNTSKEAGQLLFATYEDEVQGIDERIRIQQGDIYLDLSSGQNGVRVNLANDVDKARTLFATATSTSDTTVWTATIDGVDKLYDGLTIALRIMSEPNPQYNCLRINNLDNNGDGQVNANDNELIWYLPGRVLKDELPVYSEVLLTYRTSNCGIFNVPAAGQNQGALPSGITRNRGWVVSGVTSKLSTLTLGDDYTYDGSSDVSVPLGTIITLKTWE